MLTAGSWLVGTTNSIVTQQRDCQWDLLINVSSDTSWYASHHVLMLPRWKQIDQNTFEFHDKELEKLVSLTPSDRVWMDQVVKSVEETWNPVSGFALSGCERMVTDCGTSERSNTAHGNVVSVAQQTVPNLRTDVQYRFRGSDDDLRSKFEEYICSALSTMKYADYIASGQTSIPMPGGEFPIIGPTMCPLLKSMSSEELPLNVSAPFSEKWLSALKGTSACKTWYKSTDELLFDICEPR
jgi:hypothetical protein